MAIPEVHLDALFGVDRVNHGDPDEDFSWEWPPEAKHVNEQALLVPVKLHLADGSVHLMAQHVWQSALTLAELVAKKIVNVENKVVLEVGAGAALPSIVARKVGAKHVIVTDYPEPEIVANMERNVLENASEFDGPIDVKGFLWGTSTAEIEACAPENCKIDLVIMADTLWMEGQHDNLLTSLQFLAQQNPQELTIISTYMNHDNGKGIADRFFQKATTEYGFQILDSRNIAWRKGEDGYDEDESDDEDPERYGPVHFKILKLSPKEPAKEVVAPIAE